jgi:hypothetical protein
MTAPFIENESYKHKMAKEVLKKWFEETETGDGYMGIGDIQFRSNRKSGIFLEYPICTNITANCVCPSFYTIQEIMEKGHSFDDALKQCDCEQYGYDVLDLNYEKFYKMTHTTHTNLNSWESNWDEIVGGYGGWNEYVPTYDECVNTHKSYPIAIIDVVCSHKGSPRIGIEICHKNPVSQTKINKLKEIGVDSLIEIDAEWILQQTKRPSKLKYKTLI